MTALDPNQFIMYKLFRDATKYIDGEHVKVRRICYRSWVRYSKSINMIR